MKMSSTPSPEKRTVFIHTYGTSEREDSTLLSRHDFFFLFMYLSTFLLLMVSIYLYMHLRILFFYLLLAHGKCMCPRDELIK